MDVGVSTRGGLPLIGVREQVSVSLSEHVVNFLRHRAPDHPRRLPLTAALGRQPRPGNPGLILHDGQEYLR